MQVKRLSSVSVQGLLLVLAFFLAVRTPPCTKAAHLILDDHSQEPDASFQVTATGPEPNALAVSPLAHVTATFNANVDVATVTSATFPIWGTQTGRYTGTYGPLGGEGAQFEAAAPFKPGEVVFATASSGIQSGGGEALSPYVWQFSAEVAEGTGKFPLTPTYATGRHPCALAAGDLDEDGDLDLAVANCADDTVSVLLSEGNGTFAAQITYGVGDSPSSVAAGDLDGDGDLDLAVANRGQPDQPVARDDTVSVLLNQGDGTFAGQVGYAIGLLPTSVAVGDLDGDGDLDLVVTDEYDDTGRVLLNQGTGTFAVEATCDTGHLPVSAAVADLDGDGDLDLTVANIGDNTVSVLLNQGGSIFADQVVYAVGDGPLSVAAGDLDGDGDLDLALANRDDDTVSVLRNQGDGTFAPHVTFAVGNGPRAVATGDLDGDGDLDLIVANYGDYTTWVLLNLGDGTYAAQMAYVAGRRPLSVAVGDLDLDGDLDLISANQNDGNVSLLLNRGDAVFAAPMTYCVGGGPQTVVMGDLDGDGALDLAVANYHHDDLSVLRNRGQGSFFPQVTYVVGDTPHSVTAGDLDNDADLDLVVANSLDNTVSVLLNQGDGTFAPQVTYAVERSPLSVAAGDLDGNGALDLAVANSDDDSVSVLLNQGNGAFAAQVTYTVGLSPHSVTVGDLDADGDLDLVSADFREDTVSALLNEGDGTFAARVDYSVGYGPMSVLAHDLDRDGNLDLAVANAWDHTVSILRNQGDGTFSGQETYAVEGEPVALAAGDLNADGDLDLAIANSGSGDTVSVLLNRGDGTFADQIAYLIGHAPVSVATGDLDGDGDLDLAISNQSGDSVSVLKGLSLPGAPVLSSPPQSSSTCDATPAFKWLPTEEAAFYRIQVHSDPGYVSPEIDSTTSGTAYSLASSLSPGTYNWRVQAANASGTGDWSGNWVFSLLPAPSPPELLSPEDNGTACDEAPTFHWSEVDRATAYELQADNNYSFASPEIKVTVADTRYKPMMNLSPHRFYWRVRATSSCGLGAWSRTWRFVVLATPSRPRLSSPPDGESTCGTQPTFDWSEVSGAESYRIQVDGDLHFGSPEIDTSTAGTDFTPALPLSPGSYHWRVLAANGCGGGAWSSIWRLTIADAPSAPTCSSPADGARSCDSTPAFAWDPAHGAMSYRIQVSTSSGFLSPAIDVSTSDPTFTPVFALPAGTCYWRVRAANNCGEGAWSSPRTLEALRCLHLPVVLREQ